MTAMGSTARQLRAALAGAPDAALGRVVAMLDGLADRGEVDAVLEGVRPRLRALRPARPLRLARILLLPAEGALVAPADWKGAAAQIPRNAIAPLVAAVQAGLGPLAAEIEAAALGHTTDDHDLVRGLGARLWPAAGALRIAAPPRGWAEAGLPAAAAAPMLDLCAALWRHGVALWAAREAAADGPPDALLRAALVPLAAEGAAPLTAAMVGLLRHAARPGAIAGLAAGLHPAAGSAAGREVAAMLEQDAAAISACDSPAAAASAAAALGERLSDLEAVAAGGLLAGERKRMAAIRRDGAESCRLRFDAALASRLLLPAAQACGGPPADDATVAALEAAARELRQLESAGRRLGGEAAFDRALRDAVARLIALGAAPGGLTRIEIARMVEILAGPEAALPLLAG
ncbi:hypothetical protein [Falsiroseomonas sp. CW058]|uniref:hypothetical protein n=1 Tax=Falsiroseomonas sp. CW058 TaxID=3388664 RepID=UPI003D316E01